MPDDYYVSQYSGEEIDERLTAAHNAVRYDAAQSLTDAQKAQARTNIGADTVQGVVRYDASQALTDAQKTQARSNIGAGNADKAVVAALSLPTASWTAAGDNYTQTVVVSGSTANSKIDLQPDATTIAQLIDDGVSALYVSNAGGTLTAYAVGGKPSVDLTVQASRTEVTV